ncbi:hypothetical protein M5C97_24750 [Acidovorax sp. NCPPB 3859]|nr:MULTISPECIES: hypothetical protein [unclassified Acidovorax]MDA8450337.1 hypothetical protein [Acidovorax sp. GBBC 3297]MDA8459782.1 hypothetical protein [Acidovorax sp. GBBC 3333]MDA8464818.1 hypothetical protein [Acidovorax sp. GBBC 3332]MDA8469723.1 hypothetical protein [Acidovorax sp. GBBC 3299]WCM78650.1 hypothetical protein M5C94_24700 [Acidovorax sp. GBBC 712]
MRPLLLAAAIAASLALAACTTPYARKGMAGGYTDEKIDETHYRVKFDGNGNTSADRVWNFWLYRCAELTKEKGYTHFTVRKPNEPLAGGPAPQRSIPAIQPAGYAGTDGEQPRMLKTKGGGAPIFIYTPGTTVTVTTWHNDAVIALYRDPLPEAVMVLEARVVLEQLAPYVQSDGRDAAPARDELLRKAASMVRSERGYGFGGEL